jgi:hypothetical protein
MSRPLSATGALVLALVLGGGLLGYGLLSDAPASGYTLQIEDERQTRPANEGVVAFDALSNRTQTAFESELNGSRDTDVDDAAVDQVANRWVAYEGDYYFVRVLAIDGGGLERFLSLVGGAALLVIAGLGAVASRYRYRDRTAVITGATPLRTERRPTQKSVAAVDDW